MRRMIVGLALMTVALPVLGCAANWGAMRSYRKQPALPQTEGRLQVAGLRGPVDVFRDEHGVPHIFTENEHDLFFATGYVQAQDRLWEMVMLRAFAEGRMSELFGDIGVPGVQAMGYRLSMLEIDRRQRTMGNRHLGEVGAALLAESNPAVFAQLQSYCDGVNAFLDTHQNWKDLPIELQTLRVKPDPWRPADLVSFSRLIDSMLGSNLPIELMRYAAIGKLGADRGWEIAPIHFNLGPTIVPTDLLKNRLAKPRALPPGGRPSAEEIGFTPSLSADDALKVLASQRTFMRALALDDAFGSNNWIVSGKMTESGRAILANDPHLNHLEPSLFYLMHLKGAGIDVYGATFPGNPYVVLGHNRKLAWGATTSRADVEDLFVETTDRAHPNQYKYKGEWRDFTVREEIIKVNVGHGLMRARKIKVRQSIHGPIINELVNGLRKDAPALAFRWNGWDFSRDPRAFELLVTSATVDEFMDRYRRLPERWAVKNICLAMDRLMKGAKLDDFIAAMDLLDVPDQNWIAADTEGHIAYLPGGLVPIRKKGIGVMPAPGESGEFDWNGFIPLMELPHLIDPERGWANSSNNEVVDARFYPYVFSTHYGEPWRAVRVEQLIKELAPLSMDDMKRIQNDVHVSHADWLIPIIARAVERKSPTDPLALRAWEELKNWDREASLESTATVIFYDFNHALFRNTMEDELGKGYKTYEYEGYPYMALNIWLARGSSPYFDDVRTRGVTEDMDDMIVRSLHDTMAQVIKKYGKSPDDYRWGKVHWIKFYHPLALAGSYKKMTVGPFPHSGGEQTVRMAKGMGMGKYPYKTLTGPVLRHLIELGDPDRAQMMIDGSESGQYLSPHYDDLHRLWVNSQYITADMDPERVKLGAKDHLILEP
jgi:penicillin G amidase